MKPLFPLLQESLGSQPEPQAPAPDVAAMLAALEVPDLVYHSFEPPVPPGFAGPGGFDPDPFRRPTAGAAGAGGGGFPGSGSGPGPDPDPGPSHRVRLVHPPEPEAVPPRPVVPAFGAVPPPPEAFFRSAPAAAAEGADGTGRRRTASAGTWRAASLAEVFRRLDGRTSEPPPPSRSLRDVFGTDAARRPAAGPFSLVPPR